MAKPEWGVKRVCQSCATKFYDLGRSPITCPSCGTVFDPEALLKSRRPRPAPVAKPTPEPVKPAKPKPKPDSDTADDDLELDGDVDGDDEEDDSVLEDASELGEDDMSDVVVSEDDEED